VYLPLSSSCVRYPSLTSVCVNRETVDLGKPQRSASS
jgi:hypothetical protein